MILLKVNILFNTLNPTLCFTAEELSMYLKKVDPTVTIFFNLPTDGFFNIYLQPESLTKSLLDDTYRIHFTLKSVSICASNTRSVLLGAYKLLYLIGCRFLQPGNKGDYIPNKDLNSFFSTRDFLQTYTASFRHRGVCIEGANSLENVLDFIDWLPKVGYNSFFVQFKLPYTFFDRWYNHIFNPLLEKEGLTLEQVKHFSNIIDKEIKKRGLLYHKVGHGWTCEALGLEDLGWQKATPVLEESKKDWLALVNGKRDFWENIPTNTNLCYANKDIQSAFIQCIVSYAKSNPNIDYLHVWLADEHNNLCECPDCKDTLLSDQYVSILNNLDKQLSELNLSTKIVFLLYQELLWPPLQEAFKNHERFTLMFAPISRTFEKSYEDCSISDTIPTYVRNQIKLPRSLEENLSFLKKWQEKWHGDSFVYDYPLGRAHYGDPGYLNISRIISRDIKSLKSLHLNGYISCQELRVSFPNALPNYIMGLTLFDHETNFEQVTEDYFKHLYKEQSSYYQHYLQKLSDLFSCDHFNAIGPRYSKRLANRYREASELAEVFLERIVPFENDYFLKKLYFHGKYVKLLALALYHLASNNPTEKEEVYGEFIHYIQSNELSFQEALDVYRIIEVSTRYTGFSLPNYH